MLLPDGETVASPRAGADPAHRAGRRRGPARRASPRGCASSPGARRRSSSRSTWPSSPPSTRGHRRRAPASSRTPRSSCARTARAGSAALAPPPRDAEGGRVREPAEARAASGCTSWSPTGCSRPATPRGRPTTSSSRRSRRSTSTRDDRTVADARRRRAARRRATARGAGWRAVRRSTTTSARWRSPGPRTRGGCARRARSPAWARPTTGSASTRRRATCSSGPWRSAAELDDPFTLALALRFLGDIAINVEADLDKAEALLDRVARRRGGARRPVGDRAHAAVRRAGCPGRAATTTRPRRSGAGRSRSPTPRTAGRGCARSTPCRSTDRLGPEEPTSTERSRRRSAERRGERARRGDRRPVQHRDDDGPASARVLRRPRAVRGGAARASTARSPIFDDLGARWELADATRRARASPSASSAGSTRPRRTCAGDPDLRGARRTPARELDVARARPGRGAPRRPGRRAELFRNAQEAESRFPR